jgi:hypothetical protein
MGVTKGAKMMPRRLSALLFEGIMESNCRIRTQNTELLLLSEVNPLKMTMLASEFDFCSLCSSLVRSSEFV